MNPDPPEELNFRGQTLSPVSPKPLHLPNPSNIPLLEDQMDPAFNGSSVHVDPAAKPQSEGTRRSAGSPRHGQGEPVEGASAQDEDAEAQNGESGTAGLQNGFETTHTNGNAATSHPTPPSVLPPHKPFHDAELDSQTSNAISPQLAAETDAASLVANESTTSLPSQAQVSDDASNGRGQISVRAYQSNGQSSGVDIQALLDNLSSSVVAAAPAFPGAASSLDLPNPSHSNDAQATASNLAQTSLAGASEPSPTSLPAFAGLPPRPPPQNNSGNLVSDSDLRSFHLHNHQQSSSTQKYAPPSTTGLRPPGSLPPPAPATGAPGTSLSSNHLPPPPVPTFQQHPPSATNQSQPSPTASTFHQREAMEGHTSNDDLLDEDNEQRWGPEVQRKYDAFLEDERMYVTRGEWHNFPANSRLFIGNLPTEKVTKRDLFHVFHKYGKLAQVSIKQAYGFIQYLEAQDCLRALQAEQGVSVRGRKIHLEISKPQRNNQSHNHNSGESRARANRRSRTPEHLRGANATGGAQRSGDRYRGGGGGGGDSRHRDSPRGRDDYRPGRSPSPRSRGSRRSPNRRRRSRSRSPYAGRRSPSPRRSVDDDCPLPRRAPQDVPDVQIIAKDDPDRAFVNYVEKGFEARGIRCNVLILSPRLPEASVVRRQIIEGVLAVVKIDRMVQATQQFQLSVFDRSGGANNVKFEEYADLTLNICVELVLRAKQNAARVPTSQYYGLPVALPLPQGAAHPQPLHQQQASYMPYPPQPQSSSQFPALDTSSLQQLLGRAQQSTPQQGRQQAPQQPYGGQQQFPPTSDLSRLLASASGAQQQPLSHSPYQPPTQQQRPDLGSLVGLLGGQGPTPPQQQPQPQHSPPLQSPSQPQQKPDMANLMAMLGRYK